MKHVKIIEAVSLGLLHGAIVVMAFKFHTMLAVFALAGLVGQAYVKAQEKE